LLYTNLIFSQISWLNPVIPRNGATPHNSVGGCGKGVENCGKLVQGCGKGVESVGKNCCKDKKCKLQQKLEINEFKALESSSNARFSSITEKNFKLWSIPLGTLVRKKKCPQLKKEGLPVFSPISPVLIRGYRVDKFTPSCCRSPLLKHRVIIWRSFIKDWYYQF
jgi:hypothetical protein